MKKYEKYARQIESFPQFIGVKIKNRWNHHQSNHFATPSWGAIQFVTSQRAWDEAQGSLFYSSVDKKCIPQYHSNLCMLKIACHHSTWIFEEKKHILIPLFLYWNQKKRKNNSVKENQPTKRSQHKKLFFNSSSFQRWEGQFAASPGSTDCKKLPSTSASDTTGPADAPGVSRINSCRRCSKAAGEPMVWRKIHFKRFTLESSRPGVPPGCVHSGFDWFVDGFGLWPLKLLMGMTQRFMSYA